MSKKTPTRDQPSPSDAQKSDTKLVDSDSVVERNSLPAIVNPPQPTAKGSHRFSLPSKLEVFNYASLAAASKPTRSSGNENMRRSVTQGCLFPPGRISVEERIPNSPGLQEMRARATVKTLKGFKFFKDMEPGIQQKLTSIVQHISYEAGDVLFRQGDPPGSCYVILAGAVGIFVNLELDSRIPADYPPKPKDRRRTFAKRRSSSLGDIANLVDEQGRPLKSTVEGFSGYNEWSNLGSQVAVFGPGKLLGELALINDGYRGATCKLLQDTDFLVISRRNFDRILKEEFEKAQKEKLEFLVKHVPGVRELPLPKPGARPHASYFFKKHTHTRGYTFLTQGVQQEDCIYVVVSGSVEIQRREPHSKICAKRPSSRPTTPTSRPAKTPIVLGNRPRGVANGSGYGGQANMRRTRSSSTTQLDDSAGVVKRIGVLLPGGVFGSLPCLPAEPFTVTVLSAPCEVYFCPPADIKKLPPKLVDNIREYLMRAMTWRLERLRSLRSAEIPGVALSAAVAKQ